MTERINDDSMEVTIDDAPVVVPPQMGDSPPEGAPHHFKHVAKKAMDKLAHPLHHQPHVFDRLANTYKIEGKKALLHGLLHIKIIRAKALRNLDCLRGCHTTSYAPSCMTNDVSDPFVTVKAGSARLVKTRVIDNDLNPVWNEDFYVPVAHYVSSLVFRVQDIDPLLLTSDLGEVYLPVEELLKFDETGKPLRVGIHKVAALDGKTRHGYLEFFVEYVPAEMMSLGMEVPGVYFKERKGNDVKLYVNADDAQSTPKVTYGGPDDNATVWEPPRLWRDIYDSICDAKHFIYITGWSVDVTQSLLRGKERDEALKEGKYSPYIGELLKMKAEEGVVVNMLVWDDTTSNIAMPGMMGTHDEVARKFFHNTKVNCVLAPMLGDSTNALRQKAAKTVMFTHHQKLVLLDSKRTGLFQGRELLGYIGGVDLTNGRWDNENHPLFRTLTTDHLGDASNNCFPVDAAHVGPREPWHDIHCSVRGPEVLDMIKNFTERWQKQAGHYSDKLVDLQAMGLANPPIQTGEDAWCTQLFRSIDSRTAVFDEQHLQTFVDEDIQDMIDRVSYEEAQSPKMLKREKFMKMIKKVQSTKGVFAHNYVTKDAGTLQFNRDLLLKKGRDIDASVHTAMVHHIRRAEHTIYIEGQYFLSSAYMWGSSNHTKCNNIIAAEITLKICQKIADGERFAAYIVVPMWPEGIPESGAVQAILKWQHLTFESMYQRIALALKRRKEDAKAKGIKVPNEHPQDYLNFYCLANRETTAGSTATRPPKPKTIEEVLTKTRRHQIYVHSKMFIVDDDIAMIGSANINQRSLDGARDSEIVLGSWQPSHVATKESIPHGDVHGYRMHCWAAIMGRMEDIFREPSSVACVRRVNEIANRNWKMFTQEEACEMDSHLVPFPVKVDSNGHVTPLTADGCFPDTKAEILGNKSAVLPEFLTT